MIRRGALLLGLVVCAASATAAGYWDEILEDGRGDSARYVTGEDLYRLGTNDKLAAGYVAAVHDADISLGRGKNYCVPDAATIPQLLDVAWKYLQQNPETRHLSAAYLVRMSFVRAWPCRR